MIAPTAEQKLAERLITKHGKNVPFSEIIRALETADGWDELAAEQQHRMAAEIDRLIGLATVTVAWAEAGR